MTVAIYGGGGGTQVLVDGVPIHELQATSGAAISQTAGVGQITATGDRLLLDGVEITAVKPGPSLVKVIEGGVATLGTELVPRWTVPPVPGLVRVAIAEDILSSNAAVTHWPQRGGGRAPLDIYTTLAPAVNADFNGRKAVVFSNTDATPRKLQAYDLVDFFNRVGVPGQPWSIYARCRPYGAAANPYRTLFGGSGDRNLMIGFNPATQAMWMYNGGSQEVAMNVPLGVRGNVASYVWSANGTVATLRRDGLKAAGVVNAAAGVLNQVAIGHYQAIATVQTTHEYQGAIESYALVDHVLSDAEYASLDAWMCGPRSGLVIFEGNSIGIGSSSNSVGDWLERSLGAHWRLENYAIGAQRTLTIMNALATRTLPRVRDHACCILWEFGNSIVDGVALATLQGYVESFITQIEAAGGLPVLGTLPPRSDVAAIPAAEAVRIAFNNWLWATHPTITAKLHDMPQLQNTANASYFTDGIHPSDAGCRLIGDEFARVCIARRESVSA